MNVVENFGIDLQAYPQMLCGIVCANGMMNQVNLIALYRQERA